MPSAWQKRFNASAVEVTPRMDTPVDPAIVEELRARFPDFRRAHDVDGLRPEEFDGFGATVRTLRSFCKAWYDLVAVVRDQLLPDPDKRA